MKKKPTERKTIALIATPEEARLFRRIKRHYSRKTDSDMIRYLIQLETDRIAPPEVRQA